MKSKTTDCPKCGNTLGVQARYCGCGWKRADEVERSKAASCAHEGCQHSAQVRQKTPTGWANLCDAHYLVFHRERAAASIKARGLDRYPDESVRDWHKRCLEYVSLAAKPAARGHIKDYLYRNPLQALQRIKTPT